MKIMKTICLLLVTNTLLFTSCIKNPVTGQRELTFISENQERQIGIEAYQTATQAQGGPLIIDPKLSDYVTGVGQKLAAQSDRPNLSYEFVIVNDSVPNAWALPGGKIAINRGLLVELTSEAELAAVLGHEIVHAAARHGAKGMERAMLLQGGIIALGVAAGNSEYNDVLIGSAGVAASLVMSTYSRHQELESDHYGMIYMAKAGYNPEAAVRLQEIFLRLSKGKNNWLDGLFASHPPSQERISANILTAQKLESHKDGFEGKDEYMAAINGLLTHKAAYQAYDDGVKALKEKSYHDAEKQALKAIQAFDQEAIFWGLKGQALLAQKKPNDALIAFSEAIERNGDFFEFYLKRAECKKMLGDDAGSKKDAQTSIKLLPTGEAHELLGKIALKYRDTKRAIYHFQVASHAQSPAGKRSRQILAQLHPRRN